MSPRFNSLASQQSFVYKQRQGTSLQLGHLLSRVEPVYPKMRNSKRPGTVKLNACNRPSWAVEDLQSVNGPRFSLQAAMNAVRQWRFSETLLASQTVETEEDTMSFSAFQSGASRK